MGSFLPDRNTEYGQQQYWDDRYAQEEKYDWLGTLESLGLTERFHALLRPGDRILILGCGNSELTAELYEMGYKYVTSLDYSATVIEAQKARHPPSDFPELQWIVGDIRTLPEQFSAGSFDVVIDKATVDALQVDEGDVWNPREEVVGDVHSVFQGVRHILKRREERDGDLHAEVEERSRGLFVQISFQQPHFRKRYLTHVDYHWEISVEDIKSGLGYFLYLMETVSENAEE